MKLFALQATRALGAGIAAHASLRLAPHEEREFEDSEFKVRPLEAVAGERVAVCQSLVADADQTANDKLCRLLFFIGALKDARAAEVVALVPYLPYARKDRRTKPFDPITIRYVAALLEAVGTDVMMTLDVHNPAAFENAFRCPTVHIEAAPLFVEHFASAIPPAAKAVVLSPDAGGVKRARTFAAALAERRGGPVDLALMDKQRSERRVSGDAFGGDVRDAAVIVVDDLISGGTTMARAAAAARARGAVAVHAAATHGLFSAGAAELLRDAGFDSIVVTDSVGDPRKRVPALGARVTVLHCAPLLASALGSL